jgi:hypothetical protein
LSGRTNRSSRWPRSKALDERGDAAAAVGDAILEVPSRVSYAPTEPADLLQVIGAVKECLGGGIFHTLASIHAAKISTLKITTALGGAGHEL